MILPVLFLAAKISFPMPPDPVEPPLGCNVQEVALDQKVDIKDVSKGPRAYLIKVWSKNWPGTLINNGAKSMEEAVKICPKWVKFVEKNLRKGID